MSSLASTIALVKGRARSASASAIRCVVPNRRGPPLHWAAPILGLTPPLPCSSQGKTGEDCSVDRKCPNGCSSRGTCRDGRCFCDPGYEGSDCAIPVMCPLAGSPRRTCAGRGICLHGRCGCLPGWMGFACDSREREAVGQSGLLALSAAMLQLAERSEVAHNVLQPRRLLLTCAAWHSIPAASPCGITLRHHPAAPPYCTLPSAQSSALGPLPSPLPPVSAPGSEAERRPQTAPHARILSHGPAHCTAHPHYTPAFNSSRAPHSPPTPHARTPTLPRNTAQPHYPATPHLKPGPMPCPAAPRTFPSGCD